MNVQKSWERKDEALFIDLVHQYPPLWNTADKNYTKKSVKKQLYSQIAEAFKKRCPDKVLTSGSARRKFCRLRSYFQQEFRRMIRNKNDNPKWIHFEKMLFLATEDERKKFEYGSNFSIVNVKGGTTHYDNIMKLGAIVPNTSCSDNNEGMDSLLSQQLYEQSNENYASPIQQKNPNTSSPMCHTIKTETPEILKAWSTSESDEPMDSLHPPVQSSKEDSEPPLEQNTSHPVCDSTKTESPTAEGPPAFNVALGNLVVASLNQMPVEKANAATKEIFDVLLKYGSESNHRR